jgi:hypothetical protein
MSNIKNKNYLTLRSLLRMRIFWRELFYFFCSLMFVFILLEIIWPNIVLAYFNLNYLLLVCLITALILLIVSDYQKNSAK